jgi:hypothetical protein
MPKVLHETGFTENSNCRIVLICWAFPDFRPFGRPLLVLLVMWFAGVCRGFGPR